MMKNIIRHSTGSVSVLNYCSGSVLGPVIAGGHSGMLAELLVKV